jgi:hypothetical protein
MRSESPRYPSLAVDSSNRPPDLTNTLWDSSQMQFEKGPGPMKTSVTGAIFLAVSPSSIDRSKHAPAFCALRLRAHRLTTRRPISLKGTGPPRNRLQSFFKVIYRFPRDSSRNCQVGSRTEITFENNLTRNAEKSCIAEEYPYSAQCELAPNTPERARGSLIWRTRQ